MPTRKHGHLEGTEHPADNGSLITLHSPKQPIEGFGGCLFGNPTDCVASREASEAPLKSGKRQEAAVEGLDG